MIPENGSIWPSDCAIWLGRLARNWRASLLVYQYLLEENGFGIYDDANDDYHHYYYYYMYYVKLLCYCTHSQAAT